MKKWYIKELKSSLTWTVMAVLGVWSGVAQGLQAQDQPIPQAPQATPPAVVQPKGPATQTNPPPQLNLQLAPLGRDLRAASSYAPVVKKVEASVVTVYSTKNVKETKNPLSKDPLFRRFFGGGGNGEDEEEDEDSAPPSHNSRPRPRQEQSLGSGVIVTADGYILSNSHVVDEADEVRVTLADGTTEYKAKVIGVDSATDISVLKVEANNLPAIAITDSTTLQVGDTVLAVGNPFGVGQTVTMGIVSAMGRGGFGITDYEDFIQTDASINPGNSGGALVDVEGRLVGVPTAILSRSGGNVGIGFAVPVNMARTVMDLLIKNGKVSRGYLGVFVQTLTPTLRQAFKLQEAKGALVSGVAPKSPASASGLHEGDVIMAMNDKPVSDSRHLRLMIAQNPPNSEVQLKVWRDGQQKTLTAKLGELPTEPQVAKVEEKEKLPPTGRQVDGNLGLELRPLDPTIREHLKVPQGTNGVLVEGMDRTAPAYSAGLRPGDVIMEVNRKPVQTPQQVAELSKTQNSGMLLMKVWSKGGSRYVVVEMTKKDK